jgi:ferredoxin
MFYTSSRQVLVAKFTNPNKFFYQKECNMRGIETGKVRIRHEVFTEIARLAYEGGDYAKRLEELPFKIIPGEIGTYRDSLFLERAVVGERLRLAMGLPLRKFSEFSLLSDGVEKALDPEVYYEKPLINVIKFACNKCPDNVVKITNVCQGCLEHPCMSVCPRQAITRINGQAHIDQDKCIRCGRCLKECKFNAIVRLERPCRKACGMDCIHSDGHSSVSALPTCMRSPSARTCA